MSDKPIVPTDCFFQGCYNPAYEEMIRIGKEKCYRYNQLSPNDREKQQEILSELLGSMGKEVIITPPFWCDYGYNITVGDFFIQITILSSPTVPRSALATTFSSRQTAALPPPSTQSTPNCERQALRSQSPLPLATTFGSVRAARSLQV